MIKKLLTREIILYIVFGVLTSIINVVSFYFLCMLGIDYLISNLIALVITKLSAYLCNKYYVFKTKCENIYELIKEFTSFFLSRAFTLLIDYFGLILLIEVFNIDKVISKVIVTIIVVIINYVLAKKYVFKK